MTLTLSLLAAIAIVWALVAIAVHYRLGLGKAQALLYAPFKLVFRIDDRAMRVARKADAPVIYAVVHQSRIEPALMLSLLPADTLHILDEASAASSWLEPWRELARTIAFNAEHIFVSRRLVRVLRGKGRLAVYIPDDEAPDVKALRLYRAIAHIAMQAEARIVPIFVDGSRLLPGAFKPAAGDRRSLFPKLSINVLEPMSMDEMTAASPDPAARKRDILFDRVALARPAPRGNGAAS
ncbi:2-acyl-glycerophospho-ethanolamine acyltransferase [Mesorhizobium sp. SP-1A]|uniref:2-acyl-glycerophospho-ethanolamine acyltransferase n=1 Tax=Mesorhizobium sp. SP-1A TaxID=3077840 RepID=UPI0028F720EA|nr:2-acyl-glycerophospho-ethanolamine acyltransferase [Mesorhizobium sp. SP-1A]